MQVIRTGERRDAVDIIKPPITLPVEASPQVRDKDLRSFEKEHLSLSPLLRPPSRSTIGVVDRNVFVVAVIVEGAEEHVAKRGREVCD